MKGFWKHVLQLNPKLVARPEKDTFATQVALELDWIQDSPSVRKHGEGRISPGTGPKDLDETSMLGLGSFGPVKF